tara:strand:+ start:2422 stop:3069 length:648 start_codon:yes stop_codon:yes gene_type:complete
VKKVISYSLWGDNPIYTHGALRNLEMAKEIYPDWICRFYLDKNVPEDIVTKLKEGGAEVYKYMKDGDWYAMFWRFLPVSDPKVDVMISRDCDSRLTIREKEAVEEWLKSDKLFHIMRDHPYHKTEILGGMWGVKKPLLNDMKSLMGSYKMGNFWQTDQNFLRERIYPLVKDYAMVHDEYFEKTSFPSPRVDGEFVGEAFNENDELLHPEHREILK